MPEFFKVAGLNGAVSSIFSITLKSQKTHFYLRKPKNNGPVVSKWVFQYMETNKYVWIGMARMEMASDLKTSGRTFPFPSFCPCVSDKISKNYLWLVFVLIIHLILSPWWSDSNSCVSKKIGKSP